MCNKKIIVRVRMSGMLLVLTCGLWLMGCAVPATSISILSPGESSVQLLTERSVGILEDRLTVIGDHSYTDSKPQMTIVNKTMHTLTVDLSGSNGTYSFMLDPKRDKTWLVNQGVYHVEVGIPGFPPSAADGLSVNNFRRYKWELWKAR